MIANLVLVPSLAVLSSSLALTVARRKNSGEARSTLKHRLKCLLGRLLFPAATAHWEQFVQQNEMLREQADRHAVLMSKIYRPYLSHRLGCAQKVEALIEHYTVVDPKGLTELVRRAASADVELARLTCKSGQLAQIHLSAIHEGHREGELTLKLRHAGVQIYSASLLFVKTEGRSHLMIGRLQGSCSQQSRDLVREATRDLHACRPGPLMIALARHIAHCVGCEDVLLVSNRNRIALNACRRRRISSDYDRLWLELGAQARADGNFQIPCLPGPDVDPESAPSRKRGEVRRKLAMQQALFADVGRSFSGVKS